MTGSDETTSVATLEGVATDVVAAVEELREQFLGHPMAVTPDGAGGVSVIVDGVTPGSPYVESTTWLGFQVVSAYPDADVYPHFTGRLQRVDGRPHGEGFAELDWQGRSALQLSRRSNNWNRQTDTAALKAMKVITWLGSR
ncbi:hypothetical protein NSZ01_00400 [Nocardioides szechwanensis]|uniref:Uncharacterized protein n=1 Tax=Nocardioides szechwanensis TaxID=1005944 RepID=A0A1G9XLT8_9ACTN|nr:hypothetical protein [Nocardioides szechwanensis]GEP32272.1 hypothetical protein NSZ01_00400 [Nocardioides szechwanensis]SDM97802.1 hypothetical protein SAMN05192576_1414 [Nocardioides szechwanensis]